MPQDRPEANAQGIIAEMNASSKAKAVKVDSPGNDVVAQDGEGGRTGQQSAGKDTTGLGTEYARVLRKRGLGCFERLKCE